MLKGGGRLSDVAATLAVTVLKQQNLHRLLKARPSIFYKLHRKRRIDRRR